MQSTLNDSISSGSDPNKKGNLVRSSRFVHSFSTVESAEVTRELHEHVTATSTSHLPHFVLYRVQFPDVIRPSQLSINTLIHFSDPFRGHG